MIRRIITTFTLALAAFLPVSAGEAEIKIPHWTVFFTDVAEIRRGLRTIYSDSPSAKALMDELAKANASIIIDTALMTGARAGRTVVHDNNSAEIRLDLRKARVIDGSILSVLAHELFHVKDGLLLHAPGDFHRAADQTKLESWDQRAHEKVAIEFEKKVILELRAARKRSSTSD